MQFLLRFTYEYDFICQLVDGNHLSLLSKFAFTSRFVDDLFSARNDLFHKYFYISQVDANGCHGIYPDFLKLSCEQDSHEHVSFLDVQI